MLLYLAGPISSKFGIIGEMINILKARRIAHLLWKQGFIVICPHTNCFLMHGLTREQWYKVDYHLLRVCDAIVMMPTWKKSPGAVMELEYAKKHGIRQYYWYNQLNGISEEGN